MRGIVVLLVLAGFSAFMLGCSKEDAERKEAEQKAGEKAAEAALSDETVVVKVNGEGITKRIIDRERERMIGQLRGAVSPQQLEAMRDSIDKQAVEKAVNRVLLDEVIEKEGIKVSKEKVDEKINEIKGSFGSEELFSKQLAAVGMTVEEFEREVESGLGFELIYEMKTADVKDVTDSDVKSYYDENIDRFQQPEQIKASHILIKADMNADEAKKIEKKQQTLDLLNQVRGGANFAQLAALHSDCPSKARGGDLGYFGRGQMVKPFEDAAFALKVGEVSGIVETNFGYHIIKVTDHKDARALPLEEVKDRIKNFLDMDNRQKVIMEYLDSLRADAEIEYIESAPVN